MVTIAAGAGIVTGAEAGVEEPSFMVNLWWFGFSHGPADQMRHEIEEKVYFTVKGDLVCII
jgi:hypothetical protein